MPHKNHLQIGDGPKMDLELSGPNRENSIEKFHQRFQIQVEKNLPEKTVSIAGREDLDLVGTVKRAKTYPKKERISIEPGLSVHGASGSR